MLNKTRQVNGRTDLVKQKAQWWRKVEIKSTRDIFMVHTYKFTY